MFFHNYKKLPSFRTVTAEWLVLGSVLMLSGLMIAYFIWNERNLLLVSNVERMRLQTLIIDENLSHQLEGVRSALDSARGALRSTTGCTTDCRRILLQSLKRAMPGVRALLVLDRKGDIVMSDDDLRDPRLDDHDYTSKVERMRDADTLYLSQPYENTPGVFNIKLSMAVIDAEGHNDGAVSAIINPEYFDAVMRSALYTPDMNSAITEDGGRRILFVPADPAAMRCQPAAITLRLRPRLTTSVLSSPSPRSSIVRCTTSLGSPLAVTPSSTVSVRPLRWCQAKNGSGTASVTRIAAGSAGTNRMRRPPSSVMALFMSGV
jgi:hypothetical protein